MSPAKFQIVVSRYLEDISWLNFFSGKEEFEILIYNKGEKLDGIFPKNFKIIEIENIGRESHTYLHYLIDNYNSLPEKIIFTQGDPRDHVPSNFLDRFEYFTRSSSSFEYFSSNILDLNFIGENVRESGNLNGRFWENKHSKDSPCVKVPSLLIENLESKKWIFGTGAIFGVNKNLVESRDKSFYEKCIDILRSSSDLVNPPEGHAFERSWYLIFNL